MAKKIRRKTMNELTIVEPEITDLQASSGDMLGQAAMLTVRDDESFSHGGEMLLEIKRRAKIVDERFAEPVSLAHKAHKALTALRDSVLSPFKQAENTIKGKLGIYQMEVERKRQQEAERLRKEAEAKAEADRLAKAEKQMDSGDLAGCQKTLEAPIAPVAVKLETPEPPKVAGVSFREVWKYEVVDPNIIPREYLIVDESKLRRVVGALGKAAANIPGIRVYSEKVVSAGRAA
jgi:hypothetical protein